ncbi:monovalent cation:proton antiporter-2 (CPA2) family protein [Oceanimonas baumannii]|uniref:Glutathione-regulated potassium-efflux system protein KefB n=1 Tax=Oceanimonas baumannii TaxID=129578 RepID=A0A235CHL3_9GAMM|nr:monovalent cation:proton antiporter-2 (CPA2) family protein [Oceanimonas baumannii]OYD23879.1 glutathione-regulated potassium-efflux system protein KefB [Oceanimonas baumannii]TDW58792.1 glutathione-regulated potassium-efflux system protein KefB [Oceanimonas baumannii]
MADAGSLLQASVIFLLTAVVMVPLAKHLKLGAVLGYLLGGVIIGPAVTGLISAPHSVAQLSELGVVMLMFLIGLELSPKRLWVMRRAVFGAGMAQVMFTGIVLASGAWLVFSLSPESALVLGFGLALSSTAMGLQLLAERKALNSPHGRQAFAILLFQDIAAIPLIALVPVLGSAQNTSDNGLWHLLQVVLSIGIVFVGGRYLLRPVFRVVAKTGLQEVSTATALLVVMGTAWLMEWAGVSMALGAFLAGVLLADSEYRHELESQIAPFEGLLLGLFFIGVGMTADLSLLFSHPWQVLGLAGLLLTVKCPLLVLVGRQIGRLSTQEALRLGLLLAAGGEFAFVLFKLALQHELMTASLHDLLVLTITVSMALTPLLLMLAARWLRQVSSHKEVPPEYHQPEDHSPRAVIVGMGRMGQIVARMLRAQRVPFVAFDNEVDTISFTRSIDNIPIYYGDPLRAGVLRTAGAEQAEFFIVATDDPETNLHITSQIRRRYPNMKVIARARNRQHVHKLWDLGAYPVRETFHSSLEMSRQVLLGLGLTEEQTDARLRRFRQHDESVLIEQHKVYNDETAVIQTARQARAELENLFESDRLESRPGALQSPEQ